MREIASEIDRQIYIEKQRDKTDRKDRQRDGEREREKVCWSVGAQLSKPCRDVF